MICAIFPSQLSWNFHSWNGCSPTNRSNKFLISKNLEIIARKTLICDFEDLKSLIMGSYWAILSAQILGTSIPKWGIFPPDFQNISFQAPNRVTTTPQSHQHNNKLRHMNTFARFNVATSVTKKKAFIIFWLFHNLLIAEVQRNDWLSYAFLFEYVALCTYYFHNGEKWNC